MTETYVFPSSGFEIAKFKPPVSRSDRVDSGIEKFHLQGQHDQQSHAGGRAVDPTSPAARRGWKPLKGVLSERPIEFDDYENRYRVTAANGEQIEARVFASSDNDQVLRSPAWKQRIADGLNGAVDGYDADPTPDPPHVIVIDELPFGLPEVAGDAIAFVATSNGFGPPPESLPWDASFLRANTITFNGTPRGREMWEVMEERASEIMMPSVSSTSVANYTGIHEYGHTRAALDGIPVLNDMYDSIRPLSLSSISPEWKQLSRYGKANAAEAHAETYADWVLSQGVSDNAATRFYADRLRWGQEREDALAAAAGATRLRDQWVYCFDGPKGGVLVTRAPEGVDFHLDGQHDQQTHAGGRGSAPDSPVAESSADIRTEGARNEDRPQSRAAFNGSNDPLPFLPQAPLDLGEIQAVEKYMGVGIIFNSQLRKGRLTPTNETTVRDLDSGFEQSAGFTEDTDVYRLVPREFTVHPDGEGWGDPPGFTDDGYLSTTYDKRQLQGISDVLGYGQTHVPIKIRVKAGTKGLHISDSRFQSEVLLPRGGTVKPVGFENGDYVWGFETEDTDG